MASLSPGQRVTGRHGLRDDPCERMVAEALDAAGIEYERGAECGSRRLDFYLPELGVFVEVKQFSTPRTAEQIAGREDVILLQGKAACAAFGHLIGAYEDA